MEEVMLKWWLFQGEQNSLRKIMGAAIEVPFCKSRRKNKGGVETNKSSLVKLTPFAPKKNKGMEKTSNLIEEIWNHVDLHTSSEDLNEETHLLIVPFKSFSRW